MKNIAYFTMEIAPTIISNDDFRTYSGGLGVLAGDYFKQATDENRPITFISILWKNGYNIQTLKDGNVVDYIHYNSSWKDYVTDTGKIVKVKIENFDLTLKIWKYNQGELYMLDADLDCNYDYRYLTYNLYGGHEKFKYESAKERICQEIILGIGGMFALEALNKDISLYHFNDGHAIFAVHKIIYEYMQTGMNINDAISKTREIVRFTTHTNVPSGNETHDIGQIMFLGANYGLTYDILNLIGNNPYGMTVAALNVSGKVNAVSKVHGISANILWNYLNNIPYIFPITNGVHLKTWQHEDIHEAYIKNDLDAIVNIHNKHKNELIEYIYDKTGVKLNLENLIIGFARRATGYKRWDLFAKSPETLDYVIKTHNVQFVFAGKCHKDDYVGREYIQIIYNLSEKYPNNIVFLEGYDVRVAKKLESGSDIWLNTPNGLEASGTSGMKAGANGCVNFSTLDGWWKEACDHGVNGFMIHLHQNISSSFERDIRDAESLMYHLINDIIPVYTYDKHKWTNIMYNSIKTVEEYFNTERMIAEYFEKLYI